MRIGSKAAGLAAILVVAAAPGVRGQSDEREFLSRFAGSWSGSGSVIRRSGENPTNVNCRMAGTNGENQVSIRGTCRAYLVFTREIGADIRFDPGSGQYSGTYTGSTIGPAALSGTRNGDAVNLTITWPRTVNGDTSAAMTIQNAGNGRLQIVVSDQIPAGGPQTQVTNIMLSGG